MSSGSGFSFELLLAIAILAAALGLFVWQVISRVKRVGGLVSQPGSSRLQLLVGAVSGLAIVSYLYFLR